MGSLTDAAAPARLTPREAEVLTLVQRHLTNTEIADELYVSVRTVESHVSALLRKLGVEDRRALARLEPHQIAPDTAGRGESGRPSLPSSLTPFIGRVSERAALADAARRHRLVTATGPGGVGKTRLALAVAHDLSDDYRDGVAFVDLVKVIDPSMVVAAVADTMGISEQAAASREETMLAALSDRECLIVIDNCEHVPDGARASVERLLGACPRVRVLATSRIRLMLPFEHVFVVPGLSIEASDGERDGDAVELFVARMIAAGAVAPTARQERDLVQEICRRLDGMALAIELAAARTPSLGLDGLNTALGASVQLLTVGHRADDRHRSLRAAIDWSYNLLDDDERAALRDITVFAAPFDLDAAVAVTARDRPTVLDILGRLVDWNLAALRHGRLTRYRVLETIRQYASERAAALGELDSVRDRHLGWCRSRFDDLLARGCVDDDWCADVDFVLDDARAALTWASDRPDQRDNATELAEVVAAVSFQRGRLAEAQQRYEDAAIWSASRLDRHRRLRLAAGAAATRNAGSDAVDLLDQAAAIAQAAGEADLAAEDLANAAMLQRRASGIIATDVTAESSALLLERARRVSRGSPKAEAAIALAAGWAHGTLATSRAAAHAALERARAVGDPLLINGALDLVTVVQLDDFDLDAAMATARARDDLMARVAIGALSGFEHFDSRQEGCHVALAAGDLPAARQYADAIAALAFFGEERHIGLARRMEVDAMAGDFDAVITAAESFERDWVRAGRPVASNLAVGTYATAMVYGMIGDATQRARWIQISRQLLPPSKPWLEGAVGWAPTLDALLYLHIDDPHAALDRLVARPDDHDAWANPNHRMWLPWYAAAWAEASALVEHPETRERLTVAQRAACGNPIALMIIERAEALHYRDHKQLATLIKRFTAAGCPYQAERTKHLT